MSCLSELKLLKNSKVCLKLFAEILIQMPKSNEVYIGEDWVEKLSWVSKKEGKDLSVAINRNIFGFIFDLTSRFLDAAFNRLSDC